MNVATTQVANTIYASLDDLRRLVTALPTPATVVTFKGRYEAMNRHYARVMGLDYRPDHRPATARHHWAHLVDDDLDRTIEVVERLRTGEVIVGFQNRHRPPYADSTIRHVRWTAIGFPQLDVILALPDVYRHST